ncbi:Ig-like domain-containing protein, partial [Pseudomonas corrugata]|uniref:Ig-like domain-containing protein n=1 Tax=Pseudomonas corrugata TaxID=47879 RepID=UPI0018EF3AFB
AVSSSDGGVTWTATFTPSVGISDTSNVITLDNTGVRNGASNAGVGTTDSNN